MSGAYVNLENLHDPDELTDAVRIRPVATRLTLVRLVSIVGRGSVKDLDGR